MHCCSKTTKLTNENNWQFIKWCLICCIYIFIYYIIPDMYGLGTSIIYASILKLWCSYMCGFVYSGCHVKQWKCSEKYYQNVFVDFAYIMWRIFPHIGHNLFTTQYSTELGSISFFFSFSRLSFIRDGPFKHLRLHTHTLTLI